MATALRRVRRLAVGPLFHLLPALLSDDGRAGDQALLRLRFGRCALELWRISVESALAHPLLGVGPMHFAYVDNGDGAHPHNFWLQLAAESGVPAALLIGAVAVGFFVSPLAGGENGGRPAMKRIGVAMVAVVLAWGIGTLSDGYMVIPTSQAMSTAVLMLAVMWLRLASPVDAASERPAHSAVAWTGLLRDRARGARAALPPRTSVNPRARAGLARRRIRER